MGEGVGGGVVVGRGVVGVHHGFQIAMNEDQQKYGMRLKL